MKNLNLSILNKNYRPRKKWIFWTVVTLLAISIIYAGYMLTQAPSGIAENEYQRVKSDYVLMIFQCVVGLIVIFIPSKIERKYSIDIPDIMEIIFFLFLFAAIYLGEVRNFYFRVPHWDSVLHGFSALMLGALGFLLVNYINDTGILDVRLSPFFVALFAFNFTVTVGVIWEIYEFLADGILQTNMQKFITAEGEILIGREALTDTMKDLIVDAVGGFVVAAGGYFALMTRREQKVEETGREDKFVKPKKE
ncbi:hypothetical protein [Lacticigenium naphthae]|uniref:hypothetical protein n=1 Tax=Lacticigenium naphthae TaxID=515351 RepID=UPI000418042B|nr:hypothetical protein [Lacticigenium naphthae]